MVFHRAADWDGVVAAAGDLEGLALGGIRAGPGAVGVAASCGAVEEAEETMSLVAELANKGKAVSVAPEFWEVVEDNPRPDRNAVVQFFWRDGIHPNDEKYARLFAAAPDLLQVCREAKHLLQKIESATDERELMAMAGFIMRIEGVIAKAEGSPITSHESPVTGVKP